MFFNELRDAEHEYVGFIILPPVEIFLIGKNTKNGRFFRVLCDYL